MRFALINDERVEASAGLNGVCPVCGASVIAKCGNKRVSHWAHKSLKNCDHWWETETEWHRLWKNNFPKEWQEIVLYDDSTGEKHVADVRTDHGLVLEFQHSNIIKEERISRERFYNNMIWIADGLRLKRDFPRFKKAYNEDFSMTEFPDFFWIHYWEFIIPQMWHNSNVPIVFDYKGFDVNSEIDELQNYVWCLLPKQTESLLLLMRIERADFIDRMRNSCLLSMSDIENIEYLRAERIASVKKRKLEEQQLALYYLNRRLARLRKFRLK